ncbi:CHAT domain-containing protein [Blastococcus capsensis]|uniref:CHAT domain-containing protein n=1 Tax=Blastococcus capsensis TaxID=1564163 RepID=UPI002540EECC|nr:CHAT domain-containing protein [Blastococcus capsensis]MDK3257011.1 CHAT domain-containing protein [Blastococcus capsensis]
MGGQPDEEPTAATYRLVDVDVTLTCPRCSAATTVTFPVLSDWRDRGRMERLRSVYPAVVCPACGEAIPVPTPVVVLRPTDPIPVLFCVTDGAPEHLQLLQEVLGAHATDEDGVIAGPVANTDPSLLGVVADQYSGFGLLGVAAAGQEWAADERIAAWLAAMRTQHPWPAVGRVLGRFLSAGTEADARRVFDAEPVLSESAWEPVVRALGVQTAAAQQTADQAATVRDRMRRLARWRLGGRELHPGAATVQQAFTLLEQVVSLQSAANRSQDDVRRGVELGRQLIDLSEHHFGPAHPLTLTALNDTAALMLDDAAAPGTMTTRARQLLRRVLDTAIGTRSAAVTDATTNLGLAQLRGDRVADADVSETAITLLRDALHLHQLYFVDEPERALSAVSNLATLMRSRLAGDPATNLAAAIALFQRAQRLAGGPRQLTLPDRLTLETNLLSALADRATLEPSDEHDREVLAAVDALERELLNLAPHHPARIRASTNFGSIALGLLYRRSRVIPADLADRAHGWLREAHKQSQSLPADDVTRILAASTLAALLFRLGDEQHIEQARDLLTNSAEALTDTSSTRLHHTVFDNFARLHLARGDWDAAIELLVLACRHADAVIARAATPATRLAQVAAAGDLYQRLALLYAHRQDARSAIHTVERARARWRIDPAQAEIDSEGLDRAVEARLGSGRALLYAGTCGLGSYAVLLLGGRGAAAWTTLTTTADLAPVLTGFQSVENADQVAQLLDAAADQLAEGLLDQAVQLIRSAGITHLGIVAAGALAGLPLAALPGPSGALADATTVEYLIGARARHAPDTTPEAAPITVAVIDPTGDLPFAATELSAVRQYAPDVITPPEAAGLRGWLLEQLPQATHLHLSCHARYEPTDPFASRLILGDGLTVTVSDLAAVPTPRLALVVASCCQTGIVDQRSADELVGLAQTFVAAGADSAVASLWEVDDAATSLLIGKFYGQLAAGDPPAAALAAAQHYLKTAAMGELLALAQRTDDNSWIPAELRRYLRTLALHPDFRHPASRPFEHPAHWAGLVYLGA